MSWTVNRAPSACECIPDGSTDLDLITYFPVGMKCHSIQLSPSAVNDVLVVREGTDTGAIICKLTSLDGGDIAKLYFGQWTKPYIKLADCTFSTDANVKVIFNYNTSYGEWPTR